MQGGQMQGGAGDSSAFVVSRSEDGFRVLRDNGRTVMVCADEGSARQYAALLNEAYGIGFKQGFRAARRGEGV